jgi:hypothetical protein
MPTKISQYWQHSLQQNASPTLNLCIALALMLSTVYAFISAANNGIIPDNTFFNADALYIPNLIRDITTDPRHYFDWWLTPAPYFFPDWLIYGAASLLTKKMESRIIFYGSIQIILTWAIFSHLLSNLGSKIPLISGAISTSVATNLALLQPDSAFAFIYVSGHHFGGYLLGIMLIATLFSSREAEAYRQRTTIFTICLLGAISDSLFTASFVAPIVFTLLISKNIPSSLKKWALVRSACLGTFIGHFGYKIITPNPTRYSLKLDIHHILENIETMTSIAWRSCKNPFYIGILLLGACIAWNYSRRPQNIESQNKAVIIKKIAVAQTLTLLSISCLCKGLIADRYYISLFMLPVIFTPAATLQIQKRTISYFIAAAFSIAFLYLCHTTLIFSQAPSNKEREYYPSYIACIDKLSKTYEIRRGIADYWDARPISLFNKTAIIMAPVSFTEGGITERNWITSTLVFNNQYDFVAIRPNHALDASSAEKHLPSPDVIKHCEGMDIWLYTRNSLILKKN